MTREEVLRIIKEARKKGESADLRRADLSGADLRDADLRYADMYRADLSGADLRDADLRYADMFRADLSGADLRDANLRDSDMYRADLSGANLSDRIIQLGPIGPRRSYICYNATLDEMRCVCFFGTLAEFEKQVRKTHGTTQVAREYLATVRYLEEMREINR